MEIEVQIINAFIDVESGGNPAGVVLEAKVGLSETAFVSSSKSADFKLDFFTPTRQIAHCGHATIATFSYLQQLGRIGKVTTSKETIDGNRDIFIDGDMAFMEQLAPSYKAIDHRMDSLISSLGIADHDLLSNHKPFIVNTGNSFLVVPLKDEITILSAHPDFEAIHRISEEFDLIGYYIFSRHTKVPVRDAGTRMFAPRYGINEESATGMASGPLACYLNDKMGINKDVFLIEQGHLMKPPSPSVITVKLNLENGKITGLIAGGKAKVMKSLIISI
ncbi:MAG: PhzF family phenazine biosynthesis protein [Planctomycetota bacterium]|jgi:PhzF family phenazine biosynthesis protein